MNKRELRKEIRKKLCQLDIQRALSASATLFHKIEQTDSFRHARNILAYWSLPDEPMSHTILSEWLASKRILLPVVCGENLEIKEFTGEENMQIGAFNIKEPVGKSIPLSEEIDLVIIPALGYDQRGYRLGRGKGFYDKLLSALNYKTAIGVCYDFQIIEILPNDPWDIPLDKVMTAKTKL